MAFKLTDVNGYGTGALGDVTNPAGQINSYANVTAMTANSITIGTPANGAYETFTVGKEILLHVAAKVSGTDTTYLGKYIVATITAVAGSVLTISRNPLTDLMPSASLTTDVVQAITIAQFNTLTLSTGSVAPLAYVVANKYGGVLAIKCKTSLVLSGGSINLLDKGIPIASTALRPLLEQETNAGKTGWENHVTARQLLMNCGDGVAFIITNVTTVSGTASRIGAAAAGVNYFPYGVNKNTNAEVKGGSTILLVSATITGFVPDIISKGKTTGTGLGRCYIATETALKTDEGLYAQDCISNKSRLKTLGIKDFGNGVLGNVVNPTGQLNSYARVTSITGNVVVIGTPVNGAYNTFTSDSEVMFHVSAKITTGDNSMLGKFFLGKILSVSGNNITLASAPAFSVSLTDYICQLVTIPCFGNLTVANSYTGTLAWDDTKKLGGILALKASGTLNLTGGVLNTVNKGLPFNAQQRPLLVNQCSGQQKDYLPINQNGGAVLLIAKQLTGDALSRIGGTWSASFFGGASTSGSSAGYCGFASGSTGGAGYGGIGGIGVPGTGITGDTGGAMGSGYNGGSSIMIIADALSLPLVALSTGGKGGIGMAAGGCGAGTPGGAGGGGYGGGGGSGGGGGWGGGGGYGGGGSGGTGTSGGGASVAQTGEAGGGAGTCFVYANTITISDYTGVI